MKPTDGGIAIVTFPFGLDCNAAISLAARLVDSRMPLACCSSSLPASVRMIPRPLR